MLRMVLERETRGEEEEEPKKKKKEKRKKGAPHPNM